MPAPDRTVLVITYDKAVKLIHEAVVSLTTQTVLSWTPVPERFPSFMAETSSPSRNSACHVDDGGGACH